MRKGGNMAGNRAAMRQTRRRINMTTRRQFRTTTRKIKSPRPHRVGVRASTVRPQQPNIDHSHRPRWSNAATAKKLKLDNAIPPLQIFQGGEHPRGPKETISLPVRSHHGKQLPRPRRARIKVQLERETQQFPQWLPFPMLVK